MVVPIALGQTKARLAIGEEGIPWTDSRKQKEGSNCDLKHTKPRRYIPQYFEDVKSGSPMIGGERHSGKEG